MKNNIISINFFEHIFCAKHYVLSIINYFILKLLKTTIFTIIIITIMIPILPVGKLELREPDFLLRAEELGNDTAFLEPRLLTGDPMLLLR